jgi:hypothetical protein
MDAKLKSALHIALIANVGCNLSAADCLKLIKDTDALETALDRANNDNKVLLQRILVRDDRILELEKILYDGNPPNMDVISGIGEHA